MENMDMNEIITNDAVEEATEAVTEAVTSGKNGVKTGLIVGGAMVVGALGTSCETDWSKGPKQDCAGDYAEEGA